MSTLNIILDVTVRVAMTTGIILAIREIPDAIYTLMHTEPQWEIEEDDDDEPLFLCACGEWVYEEEINEINTPHGKRRVCDFCIF